MTPDDALRDKMPSKNFHGFKSMPNQGKQMMHANKLYLHKLKKKRNVNLINSTFWRESLPLVVVNIKQ